MAQCGAQQLDLEKKRWRRRTLLRRARCPDLASPFAALSPAQLYLKDHPDMRRWSIACCERGARDVCRALFADAQSVDWAVRALSHLVAASYREDRAGHVKHAIPAVLTSLLGLLSALEAFVQSPLFLTRDTAAEAAATQEESLRSLRLEGNQLLRPQPDALAATVRRGICRVVHQFRGHLHSFALPPAYAVRLEPFLPPDRED